MGSTMRRVQVHLADAPTDVLVYLVGLPYGDARTLYGIREEVAPADADDAAATVARAVRLLIEMGWVEGRKVDDWRMYRATTAGRAAVADALVRAEQEQEVSGG